MVKESKKVKRESAVLSDGWSNVITGMGTSKDKSTYSSINWKQTERHDADGLYASDEMGLNTTEMF